MQLCGDIGGTKALFALAAATPDGIRLSHERRYACVDFGSFDELLRRYRDDLGAEARHAVGGCLAVAGPLADDGGSAKITNLPWTVDAARCGALFGLPPLRLINDFGAAALGVTVSPAEHLHTLQAGRPLASAPRLVVGAGTGLGMAILLPEGTSFHVLPSEGGHIGFSPLDADQQRVHAALLAEHGRVTCERVVSGPGLTAIHRILAGASLDPAGIAQQAQADAAAPARRSLDVFLAAYGAFAGDMALTTLARGGVYLAGGIAGKILPALRSGPFLPAFNAKAEHAALATLMPVHAATDPALGLRGAALDAIRNG